MTDLQILVRQTSNPSILKMQQRLHDEVVSLGKQALEWKANCEALQLALEVERDAANLYAKQVAHWIEKHDALLDQQLAAEDRAQRDADHLAELRAYELTVANLQAEISDMRLTEIVRLGQEIEAEQRDEPVNTVTATAPKEIWLQVSDDEHGCNDLFPSPVNDDGVTWCQESVLPCEVHYIRAYLAQQAPQVPMTEMERGSAVLDKLGPHALTNGTMSLLQAFEHGLDAAEAHHGIKEKP